MNDNRKKGLELGKIYKEGIWKMPGGAGKIAWDTFNCLNPIQTVVWLKICETAYKTRDQEGLVVINEAWLNKNFESTKDWNEAVNAILDIEDMGFVICDFYTSFFSVKINFEYLYKLIDKVGRSRGAGLRIIKGLSPEKHEKKEDDEFLKKIIDTVCA